MARILARIYVKDNLAGQSETRYGDKERAFDVKAEFPDHYWPEVDAELAKFLDWVDRLGKDQGRES